MEKPKTLADKRHEKFQKQAAVAKHLADTALSDIDEALHDHHMAGLHNYEFVLEGAIQRGDVTHQEALEAREAYIAWIETGDSGLVAITDDDTLASPIGYYRPPPDLWA